MTERERKDAKRWLREAERASENFERKTRAMFSSEKSKELFDQIKEIEKESYRKIDEIWEQIHEQENRTKG